MSGEAVAPDIPNAPLLAGIAPRPAKAVVEQVERLTRLQRSDDFRIVCWSGAQLRDCTNRTLQRLGVM